MNTISCSCPKVLSSSLRNLYSQNNIMWKYNFNVPHAFSSDSSEQSGFPLQKRSLSIHSSLPHWSLPSGQRGSSVLRCGRIFLGSKISLVNTCYACQILKLHSYVQVLEFDWRFVCTSYLHLSLYNRK